MTSLAPNDKTGEDGSREKQEESIKKRAPGPGSQGPGPWDPGEVQWYCRSQCHCIEDENSIKMRRSASKMRIGSSKGSGHSLSYGPHSTFCKKTKQVFIYASSGQMDTRFRHFYACIICKNVVHWTPGAMKGSTIKMFVFLWNCTSNLNMKICPNGPLVGAPELSTGALCVKFCCASFWRVPGGQNRNKQKQKTQT